MQHFKPHCEHGDVSLVFSNLWNSIKRDHTTICSTYESNDI